MKSIFFVSKLSRVQSLGLTDSKVPWTIRSSNQSTLKETNPEYSVEGLMLKLKFQHFGQLMWRADSLEKTLMLGKTEGRKRRGWQRIRWLEGFTNSMDMSLRKLLETVNNREALCTAVHGVSKRSNWTTTANYEILGKLPNLPSFTSLLSTQGWSFLSAAAAAAKSLQSCLALCDPIDGSPPGSPVPGILQARTLEWVAIAFSILSHSTVQKVNWYVNTLVHGKHSKNCSSLTTKDPILVRESWHGLL